MSNKKKFNGDEATLLERTFKLAAAKASQRPLFLASVLATFRELEGLDEAALAERLGIATEELDRLALCRRPDPSVPATFRRDVLAICQRFGIAPASLANLLRRVAAYEANQSGQAGVSNLMAARDYEEEPDE